MPCSVVGRFSVREKAISVHVIFCDIHRRHVSKCMIQPFGEDVPLRRISAGDAVNDTFWRDDLLHQMRQKWDATIAK